MYKDAVVERSLMDATAAMGAPVWPRLRAWTAPRARSFVVV
jgi:hypothetical protein